MAFHPNVNANGTPGVSRTTLTFGDFAELRIDFNQRVSTGPLSTKSVNVYGGALGVSWHNFRLQGQYYQLGLNQSKLPGVPSPRLGFNGGYVEGGWVMTGEPILYDVTRAAWAGPKVDHLFSLEDGGIGAWVLGARYSTVNLDSNVVPGVSQSLTGGIFGGQQQIRRSCPQLVPKRLAAVHAAVPIRGRKQAEFGGHGPDRPALRDTRRPGPGRLVRPLGEPR
jgi:phosphate-selective porin OprO/OprP